MESKLVELIKLFLNLGNKGKYVVHYKNLVFAIRNETDQNSKNFKI